jgi:hypothetical protein
MATVTPRPRGVRRRCVPTPPPGKRRWAHPFRPPPVRGRFRRAGAVRSRHSSVTWAETRSPPLGTVATWPKQPGTPGALGRRWRTSRAHAPRGSAGRLADLSLGDRPPARARIPPSASRPGGRDHASDAWDSCALRSHGAERSSPAGGHRGRLVLAGRRLSLSGSFELVARVRAAERRSSLAACPSARRRGRQQTMSVGASRCLARVVVWSPVDGVLLMLLRSNANAGLLLAQTETLNSNDPGGPAPDRARLLQRRADSAATRPG